MGSANRNGAAAYLRGMRSYLLACLLLVAATSSLAATPPPESQAARQEAERLAHLPPLYPRGLDHSGQKQKGRASYYARHFAYRKMADGNRFDPNSNVAACRSLPIGTIARVTNLQNGRSALVRVADNGPHVRGRVVDVTPKVADQLQMRKAGVAQVILAPIAVPQRDGVVKLGAGAVEVSPQEVATATRTAEAAVR